MKKEVLTFADFAWPYNPREIRVTYKRNVRTLPIPFVGSALQDLGRTLTAVSGEGEFYGDTAAYQFGRLLQLQEGGGSYPLSIPGLPPMDAVLVSLTMLGEPGPEVVRYAFEFCEVDRKTADSSILTPTTHTVNAQETLWSIARQYGLSIDQLIALNPQLGTTGLLAVGSVVKLR